MHRTRELPRPFADLGLDPPLLRALSKLNFQAPTDIQREMIPLVLAGRDVLGQARTGTGKTAAFGLPILQRIRPDGGLQALILAPTRELAAQIVGELRRFSEFLEEIHCVPVYGGQRIQQQLHLLGRRPHVVVGTPGRVLDLLGRGALSFDMLDFAVLDEVDRMLDIGFRDDIKRILQRIRQEHQTIFVSATLDDEIKSLARTFTRDAVEVNVSRDEITVDSVEQYYCTVDPWDKFRLLRHILNIESPRLAIVFCNTKHGARKLARRLFAAGIEAKEIHGDLVQQKRERVMERFRRHKIPVLVATDLASRGIDVTAISHIINYDLPKDIQAYVHRIGRTARMGAFGKAISLVLRDEGPQLTEIEKLINKELQSLKLDGFEPSQPPSEFSEAPVARGGRPVEGATRGAQAGTTQGQPATAASTVPRTLGSKFPVSRRRRRR
ncbi:MAG: DEAD/DEAH box helicase [Phycisphaerae bacterium]|nr:DEAD/DEAH box helicase [Phycisphaerae bacterium]NUQ47283.1 DEAD/DEAH box helicase [Phycisphaerae bacterium]